ncbi:hypothetical protein DFAR_3710006 [Desulfarculales bacterium]
MSWARAELSPESGTAPMLCAWRAPGSGARGGLRQVAPAFLAAIGEKFPGANVIVDWFYVVQLFTTAVDEVQEAEAKERNLPKATRGAVFKAADGGRRTKKQQQVLTELPTDGFATAWRFKEMLRWIREATFVRIVQWRTTNFTSPVMP